MRIRYTCFIAFLVAGFLPCFLGCAKENRPDGMPELFPVTITILQDGAPLEGARVGTFPTDTALARWGGGGITDASGRVTMYSYGSRGLIAGEHKVTVNKEDFTRPPGMETADRDEYEFFVDTKFWSTGTTPLTIDVQRNTKAFTLEVESFDPSAYDERRFGKRLKR